MLDLEIAARKVRQHSPGLPRQWAVCSSQCDCGDPSPIIPHTLPPTFRKLLIDILANYSTSSFLASYLLFNYILQLSDSLIGCFHLDFNRMPFNFSHFLSHNNSLGREHIKNQHVTDKELQALKGLYLPVCDSI